MILVGNQRGGAYDLARHLMKEENDHVELHELRGFMADNLMDAMQEAYAVSRATKCKQFLYSLSLNPPPQEKVPEKAFEDAIARAEQRLGLEGQPRAIVFHVKEGRRHAHVVWSRIDADTLTAKQLSFTKNKLQDLARELYIEHGWQMPRGFVRSEEANPRNYTLAEWQQAKRAKRNIDDLKRLFQEAWAVSDSRAGFAHALEEKGFVLARGDRRGVVAVDYKGEVYSVSRYVGVKAKQVRERFGSGDELPDVPKAHSKAADALSDRLKELQREEEAQADCLAESAEREKRQLVEMHAREVARLQEQQTKRFDAEEAARLARVRTGLWGWIDWLTGKRKAILAENEKDAERRGKRDAQEINEQNHSHHHAQRKLDAQAKSRSSPHLSAARELAMDRSDLHASLEAAKQEREAMLEKQTGRKPRRRTRGRDGPSLEP